MAYLMVYCGQQDARRSGLYRYSPERLNPRSIIFWYACTTRIQLRDYEKSEQPYSTRELTRPQPDGVAGLVARALTRRAVGARVMSNSSASQPLYKPAVATCALVRASIRQDSKRFTAGSHIAQARVVA